MILQGNFAVFHDLLALASWTMHRLESKRCHNSSNHPLEDQCPNLSNVFGELMYLLEYRDGFNKKSINVKSRISLPGGEEFGIPKNVNIIGTMNTADRSIALVDYALRRRFAFIELYPDYDLLIRYHEKIESDFPIHKLTDILKKLNRAIGDRNYEIGVSFFMDKALSDNLEDIWVYEIEPYLEEYFFGQSMKIENFRWNKVSNELIE